MFREIHGDNAYDAYNAAEALRNVGDILGRLGYKEIARESLDPTLEMRRNDDGMVMWLVTVGLLVTMMAAVKIVLEICSTYQIWDRSENFWLYSSLFASVFVTVFS